MLGLFMLTALEPGLPAAGAKGPAAKVVVQSNAAAAAISE
jgi:hypothetical protein